MLGTSGALDRLISLATDAARQDRMLAYTYGDAAALAEITTARQLILARPDPDLAALGRLAVYQDRLVNRNRAVPTELPALWARLGQSHRAEALARSIPDPGRAGPGTVRRWPRRWPGPTGSGPWPWPPRPSRPPARSLTQTSGPGRWARWSRGWSRPGSGSRPSRPPARSPTMRAGPGAVGGGCGAGRGRPGTCPGPGRRG